MKAWAVVIAINDYGPGKGLNPLAGAVADAEDMADWLLHPQGGGVAPDDLWFWTYPAPDSPGPRLQAALNARPSWPLGGPDPTRAPTGNEIRTLLAVLGEQACTEGIDRLYVYFAGHGAHTDPLSTTIDNQACFIAGDFHPKSLAESLVGAEFIRMAMERFGPAEVILIMDCCRTPLSRLEPDPFGIGRPVGRRGVNRGVGIGLAAARDAVAYETPRDTPTRGAFSKLLVHGLRNLRSRGGLSAAQLESFVRQGIKSLVAPDIQVPSIEIRPKDYNLLLAQGSPLDPHPEIWVDLSARPAGEAIRMQRPDLTTQTLVAGPQPHVLSEPIGLFSFEIPGQDPIIYPHIGPDRTHVVLT
jgi:uncharacterized caspase-like protein